MKHQYQEDRIAFHPDFPDYWQVLEDNEQVQVYSHLPSFYPHADMEQQRQDPQANGDYNRSVMSLLPRQVVQGKIWDDTWIRLCRTGAFVARAAVQPYFPVYRVVADTHKEAHGVAPYVVDRQAQLIVPKEEWKFYKTDSPLRRPDLAQSVGHVFERSPLLKLPADVQRPPSDNWWTMDGETWWPKTVRNVIPCTKLFFPTWMPVLGSKTVMEWMTPVESTFIRQSLGDGANVGWIVGMIFLEYAMIVVGALAGVEFGWSVRLQLVYLACLILLVFTEIFLVARLVPNGSLWVKMNRGKLVGSILKGVLWRFDLYGDVGFCLLAFQQRDRILARFWIVPTALTALVIAGRLAACVYYLGKSSWPMDEKSLSKLSVPSFLTIFGHLCQDLQLDDAALGLSSARTEIRFETWRTCVEDFPEIVLQAVYLFGHQAPPACPQCAYGFVFVSLLVSIATSCPGVLRLYNAFSRYTMFQSEVQASSSSSLKDASKQKKNTDLREPTERQDD